jgi:hypothetical protein
MSCARLPEFLDGNLPPTAQAHFEQHLVACASCQAAVEAAMQMWALGAELAERPDRPRAVDIAPRRPVHRSRRWLLAAVPLAAAAVIAIIVLAPDRERATLDEQITASLAPQRKIVERLPYAALDRYRAYDTLRAGPGRTGRAPTEAFAGSQRGSQPRSQPQVTAEAIPLEAVAGLEKHEGGAGLIATLIARGEIATAENRLGQAGRGDDLDVTRALVASHKGQATVALSLLDQVLARSPRHAQALWNRAVTLAELDLPLAAAEAFDATAALREPGWSLEAASRRDELRRQEEARARELRDAIETCMKLGDGVLPDEDFVRRHSALCRPSIYVAVRGAATRDEVLRLLPAARALDEASGSTAVTALVQRIAASDFAARAPHAAQLARLRATPAPSLAEQARILAQLRASGQRDLLLGALIRVPGSLLVDHIDEVVDLARADHDPYLEEIATEYEARAKLTSGQAIEAEAILRQAVKQCAARDVELRCAYLQVRLIELYLARHRPTEATEVALAALARSRRVGLYWDERLLFGLLGRAAQLEREYPRMRAYIREASLRVHECPQVRLDQEALASAELAELRFESARAELDKVGECNNGLSLERARIEAELVGFDGTAERTAALRAELARIREVVLTPGQRAHLDAMEGRVLALPAHPEPAAARELLNRAIAAADALDASDVEGTKARNLAYRTLLGLGAKDLGPDAVLALFAGAARAQPRAGCALGAMIDGERLLLVVRGAGDRLQQVFEPRAFRTPDFDARTLVPPALVSALSSCSRVDVYALPPLYGQPQLLPPGVAWSYRGPARAPSTTPRRPKVLVIADTQPPAVLELPRLQSPSHASRDVSADEAVLRGAEATPARVRRELVQADFAEIHAHGFVDLGISDVSLIALSPDVDGSFALTARVIAGMKLPRAPFILLASCDAAYTAPYQHEPWSLPYAFLLAGARGVLAPATAVPDKEADSFFRAVGDQIMRGVDPAIVLRDQRVQRRAGAGDWLSSVVVFD